MPKPCQDELVELLERCRLHLEAMRQNPETPDFIRTTVIDDFRRLLEITDRASTPSELSR